MLTTHADFLTHTILRIPKAARGDSNDATSTTSTSKNALAAHAQLTAAFFVSGLVHHGGEYMMLHHWRGSGMRFFMLQPLAIALEDVVVSVGARVFLRSKSKAGLSSSSSSDGHSGSNLNPDPSPMEPVGKERLGVGVGGAGEGEGEAPLEENGDGHALARPIRKRKLLLLLQQESDERSRIVCANGATGTVMATMVAASASRAMSYTLARDELFVDPVAPAAGCSRLGKEIHCNGPLPAHRHTQPPPPLRSQGPLPYNGNGNGNGNGPEQAKDTHGGGGGSPAPHWALRLLGCTWVFLWFVCTLNVAVCVQMLEHSAHASVVLGLYKGGWFPQSD